QSLPVAVPEVLHQLCEWMKLTDRTAYATLNMGVGFAVFCRSGHGDHVVAIARELGYEAGVAGYAEEGPTRVVLEPIGVTFGREQLQIRHAPPSRLARAPSS